MQEEELKLATFQMQDISKKLTKKNEEKSQILPSFEEVIDNLLATSGTAYIW